MVANLVSIENLSIAFGRDSHARQVVTDVSFSIPEQGTLALVGESGSGKTVTALAIMGLHDPQRVSYPGGKIMYRGRNLLATPEHELRGIRGKEIAMIFQEPTNSLNPVYSVGEQLIEPLVVHQGYTRELAKQHMIQLLDRTGIIDPHRRFDDYPHMLSGGQRQRVMIAMALACNPRLLIADEPTTALDVTIEVQILELMEELQKEFNTAVLMITHDLNIVKRFAGATIIMHNGRIAEQGATAALLSAPQHDYTRQLVNSYPGRMVDEEDTRGAGSVLSATGIRCYFPIREGFFRRTVNFIRAVDGVDLEVLEAETVGIVGESGSGKSTLGKCLLRLQSCSGAINFNGMDLKSISSRELRSLRREIQVVFQDPYASLSPRMTVAQILGEGLNVHYRRLDRQARLQRCIKVLKEVGLEEHMLSRYPHEFSGGQRQRIAIARVLLLEPGLIILDEPTSALDVSVQKQILELLRDLQKRHGISYIFISHDLKIIQAMAHRVCVMKDGRIVESGRTSDIFLNPRDAYTRKLLEASLYAH
jgi:microcin C transport system ATP-binding protein